jgi:protein-S-isoprenylcysteine O-methyltransferase Ste14
MRVAAILIGLSWLIFFAYWIYRAIGVKRPARSGGGPRRLIGLILALAGLALIVSNLRGGGGPTWLSRPLAPPSESRDALAVVLSFAGLGVAIWARTVLGRNWSAAPEVKQDHELVTGGPYKVVRHPIYSGLLLMFAGVAVLWATSGALLLMLVIAVGIHIKLGAEEALMAGEFPEAWPPYRARTRRVIPLIW